MGPESCQDYYRSLLTPVVSAINYWGSSFTLVIFSALSGINGNPHVNKSAMCLAICYSYAANQDFLKTSRPLEDPQNPLLAYWPRMITVVAASAFALIGLICSCGLHLIEKRCYGESKASGQD